MKFSVIFSPPYYTVFVFYYITLTAVADYNDKTVPPTSTLFIQKMVNEGDNVSFDVVKGARGNQAENIVKL